MSIRSIASHDDTSPVFVPALRVLVQLLWKASPGFLLCLLVLTVLSGVVTPLLLPLNATLLRGPLAYLGRVSYGIYMIHIMVFVYFGWFDQRMDAYGVAGNLAVVAFRVAASVGAATVLWYGFESRILKLKRYFAK